MDEPPWRLSSPLGVLQSQQAGARWPRGPPSRTPDPAVLSLTQAQTDPSALPCSPPRVPQSIPRSPQVRLSQG